MFKFWKDLQDLFGSYLFCEQKRSLSMAITNAGIEFRGKAHSALTDARAAADLYREMYAGKTLGKIRESMEISRKPLSMNLGDLISSKFAVV